MDLIAAGPGDPAVDDDGGHVVAGNANDMENSQVQHKHKRIRLDSTNTPTSDVGQGDTHQATTAGASTTKSNLWHNIEVCNPFISLEHDTLKHLHTAKVVDFTLLVEIEEGLLDLASYPKCCDGIFYLAVFQDQGQVYMRYIESGSYKGSFPSVRDRISAEISAPFENALWSQVYNEEDVEHQLQQKMKQDVKRERPDKIYKRHLSGNKKSIRSSISKLLDGMNNTDECEFLGMVLHTKYVGHQQVADAPPNIRWYIHCSGKLESCTPQLQTFFQQRVICSQPHDKRNLSYLLDQRLPGYASLQTQCEAVSLIPNYPKSKPENFKFGHKFPVCDRCPASSRGTIIWVKAIRDRLVYLDDACNKLCSEPTEVEVEDEDVNETPPPHEPQVPVNEHARRAQRQPRKLTADTIRRALQDQEEQVLADNMCTANASLYDNFCTQLLEKGTLCWRYSSAIHDIFVMNDVDDSTGLFKPTDYVHCQRMLVETGYHYVCDCGIYRELILESERVGLDVADGDITCMHCRLLKDESLYMDNPSTNLQRLFARAKIYLGQPFVECPSGNTVKFSVLVDDTCTFVHLSYMERRKRNIISCLLQRCKIKKGSRRQVIFLNNGEVCPHLKIMKDHHLEWAKFLHEEDASNGNEVEDEQVPNDMDEQVAEPLPEEEVNPVDMCFDPESGLYTYKCRSTHAAVQYGTPELQSAIAGRMSLNDTNKDCLPRVHGCLKGPDKIPPVPEDMCGCNSGWKNADSPNGIVKLDRTMTLYTLHAPVEICVYKRLCLSSRCSVVWDEFESEHIHESTSQTCAGDEIGWLFIHTVMAGRQSFTGFCSMMTMLYNGPTNSQSFMCPSVFISWWFSWAANQKLDFRKPCGVCKTNPKVLACDGTKIGIAFRHQEVTAIETPDSDVIIQTPTRRFDRCYMKYTDELDNKRVRDARDAVDKLAKHVVGANKKPLEQSAIPELIKDAMYGLPAHAHPAFQRLLNDDVPTNERKALSDFFRILASSASVSSVIPYKYGEDLCSVIYHVTKLRVQDQVQDADALYNKVLQQMREYSPEMRELFAASAIANDNGCGAPNKAVTKLILSLIREVRNMYQASTPPAEAISQTGTYDPPKYGRAYYFSPSGEKLRQVRPFSMDKEISQEKNTNHDDAPNTNEPCTKVFPQVGKKGTSYLFLWFCPLHGHCYGFHIIPGSEGRKDPAVSLYTHLEHPPQKICYDFACGLEEYCLNRESGYFKDVQFSHDIFHGYSHKCSNVYQGSRLLGSEKINSEIAEQFNSFIQCIKYPARQMTQGKFVFFLQFFINVWNNKKAEKHRNKLRLALLGHQ